MDTRHDLSPDELLAAYFLAERGEEERLNHLCSTVMYPLVLQVVRAKLARNSADVEDVVQAVVIRLALELRRMRAIGAHRLGSVIGWVVASALNGCHDHFRSANRPRTQLANTVRYVLGHSIVFRVWPHAGRQVCGWRRCVGSPPLSPARFTTLMQHGSVVERARLLRINSAHSVRRVLARVFLLAHGSIEYKPLVPALVDASGLPGTLTVDAATVSEPVAAASADEPMLQRSILAFIWDATLRLPREQRLALMLHLSGRGGIHAFWEYGAVGKPQVAEALALSEERLGELPWSDLEIAEFIDHGLPPGAAASGRSTGDRDSKRRQQRVINWRRDARRALDDRLRAYGLDSPANFVGHSASSVQGV